MTHSKLPKRVRKGASSDPVGLNTASHRGQRNVADSGSIEEPKCNRCGIGLRRGGGHGNSLAFSFHYCPTCDEFVSWESFGTSEKELQEFVRFLFATKADGEGR